MSLRRPAPLRLPALAAACAALAAACSPNGGPPAEVAAQARGPALVVVDPQFPDMPGEVDLGRLQFGEVLRHTVLLRNSGSTPLTIRDIRAGCSCALPRISYVDPDSGRSVVGDTRGPSDAITLPGGVTAELELSVDTTLAPTRNKYKLVVVRLTTDSPTTPFLTLNVRLFVESPFRPAPAIVDLRQVATNGGGSEVLTLAADGEEGRRITGVLAAPDQLVASLSERQVGGVEVWDLAVRLLPPVPLGYHEYTLALSTSGPAGVGEGAPLEVEVRATGVPDAAIEPPLVTLDRPSDGGLPTGLAQLVSRLPGHTLRVSAARLEGIEPGHIDVVLEPRAPDAQGRAAQWDLRLVARQDLGETSLGGLLVIETDDEQAPHLQARWLYRP